MRILRHPEYCLDSMKGSVIALGNFDGVHKGHKKVIETAKIIAKDNGAPAAVMTFEPHPAMVLKSGTKPMRITPFRMKVEKIKALDVDILCVLPFTASFAALTAEAFIEHILVQHLMVRHIVVGEDFNFGRNRTGNADLLKTMASLYGFGVTCVPQVLEGGDRCSSSHIRHLLKGANIAKASLLLGYDYTISGRVIAGAKRGRLLGFPTANIALAPDLLKAAYGVYVVQLSTDCGKNWHGGVANLGVKPSIDASNEATLEVHLFDFNQDIYGKRVEVRFLYYMRPEQKFDGLDALKAQIAADAMQAENILEGYKNE